MRNHGDLENQKSSIMKKIVTVIAIGIIGILVVAGCMFFIDKLNRDETDTILDKISKIMILPNEKPIIDTIEDAEGLKKESLFYENVKKGDKILIYAESAKVIIYREKENKIINVGPIINDTQ